MTKIVLEPGVRAYRMPDLGDRNGYGDLESVPAEEVQARLNALFASIEEQGGEVLGFFSTTVRLPPQGGIIGYPTEKAHFIVVKK